LFKYWEGENHAKTKEVPQARASNKEKEKTPSSEAEKSGSE